MTTFILKWSGSGFPIVLVKGKRFYVRYQDMSLITQSNNIGVMIRQRLILKWGGSGASDILAERKMFDAEFDHQLSSDLSR
jgi:hypothetical protein